MIAWPWFISIFFLCVVVKNLHLVLCAYTTPDVLMSCINSIKHSPRIPFICMYILLI